MTFQSHLTVRRSERKSSNSMLLLLPFLPFIAVFELSSSIHLLNVTPTTMDYLVTFVRPESETSKAVAGESIDNLG